MVVRSNESPALCGTIPVDFGVHSQVIPSIGEVKWSLRNQVLELSEKLAQSLIRPFRVQYLLDFLYYAIEQNGNTWYRGCGVHARDVKGWKDALGADAVISFVDKNKPRLCISCPEGWQNRCINMCCPGQRSELRTTNHCGCESDAW